MTKQLCSAYGARVFCGRNCPLKLSPSVNIYLASDFRVSPLIANVADIFTRTRAAHLEHEQAKAELKALMPQNAKEAIGHGLRVKRSKSGAVTFDLHVEEGSNATVE